MSERDTHFQGVARLQYSELKDLFRDLGRAQLEHDTRGIEQIERLIYLTFTRRAYDLARHVLTHETMDVEGDYRSIDEVMAKDIPDLTAWPESEQEQ